MTNIDRQEFSNSQEETPTPASPPQAFWKISMLAERWGLSTRTINRMIRRGELQAIKVVGRWRVPDAERVRIENPTCGAQGIDFPPETAE